MDTVGTRIRDLRQQANLTVKMLADKVGCSEQSIFRYETSRSTPDTHILTHLAVVFNVTTDYLLGLSSKKTLGAKQQQLFQRLERAFNNLPQEGETYYWITYEEDLFEDTVIKGGQTQWIGYTDTEPKKELRALRPVIPHKAIDLCTKVYGQPMVLNKISDLSLYLLFGGQAIVRANLLKEHLPFMLEPYICDIPNY